jgi:UPF0755 protein
MKTAFSILGFLLLIFAGGFVWYERAIAPVAPGSDVRESITIEGGSSTADIGEFLQGHGLIRSARAFDLYTRLHGYQGALQAGKFVLRASMGVPEIVEVLVTGKAEEMIITIPEGFSVREIDALLAERGLMKAGELIACAQDCDVSSFKFLPQKLEGIVVGEAPGGRLEGYLFPDTYFVVAADFVPKFFLERMLSAFQKKVLEGLKEDLRKSGRSLHEVMTMASLVEKETREDAERAVVAGILWKRLKEGLRLDVDATVRYAVGKSTEPLTLGDLNIDSPYNSRKRGGLPPGPIANPGLKSVLAALKPKETPYWYYLHGADGAIHYAETNEQHNVNKFDYLD